MSEKVISISSIASYNDDAKKRGVKRFVEKDYANLDEFTDKVSKEVEQMLRR